MFYTPQSPKLKPFVQCIWIINSSGIPLNTKMLPDGYSDMMINLGASYRLAYNNEQFQEISKSSFFGQRNKSLFLDQPGVVEMIGIRIRPGMEKLFTGRPANSLVNKHVSLVELYGSEITELEQTLSSTDSETLRFQMTEQFLCAAIESIESDGANNKMVEAIEFIFQNQPSLDIIQLLDHLKLSYKQCERLFKMHLGLSPKTYLRVIRFYHLFTRIRGQKNVDWTNLLRDYNFYDQSHFIKDFKYFSGFSPGRQFKQKDTIDEFFGFN